MTVGEALLDQVYEQLCAGSWTLPELRQELGVSATSVRKALDELHARGRLETTRTRFGNRYRAGSTHES